MKKALVRQMEHFLLKFVIRFLKILLKLCFILFGNRNIRYISTVMPFFQVVELECKWVLNVLQQKFFSSISIGTLGWLYMPIILNAELTKFISLETITVVDFLRILNLSIWNYSIPLSKMLFFEYNCVKNLLTTKFTFSN